MSKRTSYLQEQKKFWNVEDPIELKYNRVDTLKDNERNDAQFQWLTNERVDWLLDKNDLPQESRILEIGCGIGAVLGVMQARLPKAVFHGIDISFRMIEEAQKTLGKNHRVKLQLGEGDNLSMFPSESFDFVICTGVFIHIVDAGIIKNYVKEVKRVLKPGCQFRFNIRYRHIESSFGNSLGGRLARFLYKNEFLSAYKTKWKTSNHADFNGLMFTLSNIEQLIYENGLELLEVQLNSGLGNATNFV